ncbi:MAG: hypothetical protein WCE63_08760 [Acidobacteriaceae bacterium]
MFLLRPGCAAGCLLMLAVATLAGSAGAQQTPSQPNPSPAIAQQTIGHLDISATADKIQVSGAVTLTGDGTALGNGSTVTAGKVTLPIHLTRGGQLDLCATTTVHLSQQYNASDANSPLMVALDHGAIEAHYKVGKNSDVVLTPDLRILLSGPGQADVRIRLNDHGDTCVANRGDNAPYVTVSEQMGAGVYRVMPNQRVMFEQGSVRNVVDNEPQACGCPAAPVISVANAGSTAELGKAVAKPGEAVAAKSAEKSENAVHSDGPSSTPADTAFPLAESEGLAPPPAAATKPVVAPGEIHSEVTTTLSYTAPQQTVPTGTPSGMATPESAATIATAPVPGFGPSVNTGPVAVAEAPSVQQPKPQHKPGFFHKIGRFFAKIFG